MMEMRKQIIKDEIFMDKPENTEDKIREANGKKKGPSVSAEFVTFIRALESQA